ncbi:hypothetical protein H9W95_15045 [Flavobacterium lindanitolerans]|nr:hypothetical protein [Flavobacterium lindanitolerans]
MKKLFYGTPERVPQQNTCVIFSTLPQATPSKLPMSMVLELKTIVQKARLSPTTRPEAGQNG